MKPKIIFLIRMLLCLALAFGIPGWANAAMMTTAQQSQAVQTLEDTLFTSHYDQETLDSRLGRLEETVFGQSQGNLPIEARISRLQSVLSPSSLGSLSPFAKSQPSTTGNAANNASATSGQKPLAQPGQSASQNNMTPNTMSTNSPSSMSSNIPANIQPMPQQSQPSPGEADYPTVTRMEEKIFGVSYIQEDITKRLERLEKRVFKTVQTGALADRSDNLKLMIFGDTGVAQSSPSPAVAYGGPKGTYTTPQGYTMFPPRHTDPGSYAGAGPNYSNDPANAYSGTPIASTQNTYPEPVPAVYQSQNTPARVQGLYTGDSTSPDMLAALNEVEKEVLGHTYPSEATAARLDRLETKIFKSTSPEMTTDDRMQRVIAVSSAGGAPQSTSSKAKTTIQTLLPIILTILPMLLL